MAEPAGQSAGGRLAFGGTAADYGAVGAHDGFVHRDDGTFSVADDSAAEKYWLGLRYLGAGAGRRAAALLTEAVEAGFRGGANPTVSEVAYCWALATLTGRPYLQLGPADLANLRRAHQLASGDPVYSQLDRRPQPDWLMAVDFMRDLVDGLAKLEAGLDVDFLPLRIAYRTLDPSFQMDFERHLELMLIEGIEELAEAAIARRADEQRMSAQRLDRAWMYFEQDPAAPRRQEVVRERIAPASQIAAGIGGLLAVAAVILELFMLWPHGASLAIGVVLVAVLGAGFAVRCRIAYLAKVERLADREREFGHHHATRYTSPAPHAPATTAPDDIEDEVEAENARLARNQRRRFVRIATSHLDEQISLRLVSQTAKRSRWLRDISALKASILQRVLTEFSEPELAPGSVNWLISWRIQRIYEQWDAGTLYDFRTTMMPRPLDAAGSVVGLIVAVAASVYGTFLVGKRDPIDAVAVILVLVLAAIVVMLSQVDVYLVHQHRMADDVQDCETRYQDELAAYRRWQAILRRRPDENQMASWLDLDKIHLRNLVLHQLGLTNLDVEAHATITEPAAGCRLARMPNGPPRYSAYRVTIFLLTSAGVRQVSTFLNFRNGVIHDQSRRSYRYEVITSATVHEVGVQYRAGVQGPARSQHLATVTRLSDGKTLLGPLGPVPQRSGLLRLDIVLSIGERDAAYFRAENYSELTGSTAGEDPVALLDIALDMSGITASLELLEDISGHGTDWIRNRLRRRRLG